MEKNDQVYKEILDILKDIRRGINILASTQRDKAKSSLNKLKGKRKQMYSMFNGKNSLEYISKKLNTTHENVRKFSIECEGAGLVEFIKGERGTKYPKKIV
jgi:hypothetical protein